MAAQALSVLNLRKEFRRNKAGRALTGLFGRRRKAPGTVDSNGNGSGGPDGGRNGSNGSVIVAVDDVSFDIEKGEIFGLLGPNGAGKTTTIKMISTLLRPTSGKILVEGTDPEQEPARVLARIGTVLSGERCIYWKLTGRENLEYFGALYGLRGPGLRRKIDGLLDRFQLTGRADETVEKYSTGMKRRIVLARALLHDPSLLILDEPTAGLDPQGARNLRDLILELKAEGRTILLTTHYMEEADILSDRIAVIDHGLVIAMDTPAALKRRLGDTRVVELEVREWVEGTGRSLQEAGLVSGYAARRLPEREEYQVTLHLPAGVGAAATIAAYLERGNSVQNLAVKEPTLEDVFIRLTGKSLRD